MKDGDGFIFASLLEAKVSRDALLQELQRRPLEPDKKIHRRQQHCRPLNQPAALNVSINVLDLLIRKPVEIVKDE